VLSIILSRRLLSNRLQRATWARIVHKEVVALVTTVTRKAIWPKTVINLATWTMSHAATARKLDISVEIALSRKIVRIYQSCDWAFINVFTGSKVQCSNCQKYGHTKVRCKEPLVADDGGGFPETNDNAGGVAADSSWPSGDGGPQSGEMAAENCGW
jgi:hypothetical protein